MPSHRFQLSATLPGAAAAGGGGGAHRFKWQNFSIEWEAVVLSMSPQPKRYTSAQSLGTELFIILGSMRREEASLTPACLSLESCERGPGPPEEAAWCTEQLPLCAAMGPAGMAGGRQLCPDRTGSSPARMLLPLGTCSSGPKQFKTHSIPGNGALLDSPPFGKIRFKRIKFKHEPARPVSFISAHI